MQTAIHYDLSHLSLFGKHPSCREYLYMGHNSSSMQSVIDWIQKGTRVELRERNREPSSKIHLLYLHNKKESKFICVALKSSKDTVGRSYPLVLLAEISVVPMKQILLTHLLYSRRIWGRMIEILSSNHTQESLESEIERFKIESYEYQIHTSTDKSDNNSDNSNMQQESRERREKQILWQNLHQEQLTHTTSLFVDQKFTNATLFSRPLEVNDFKLLTRSF